MNTNKPWCSRRENVIWPCIVQHFGMIISVAGWGPELLEVEWISSIMSTAQDIKDKLLAVKYTSVGLCLGDFLYQFQSPVSLVPVSGSSWYTMKFWTSNGCSIHFSVRRLEGKSICKPFPYWNKQESPWFHKLCVMYMLEPFGVLN